MKRPSATALIAIVLLVIAVIARVATRPAPDQAPAADSKPPAPAGPPRHPAVPPAPLALDEDGLPEFSNYDPDDDGNPNVDAFIAVYRRVRTPEGKIDMLGNVRTFETPDDAELNALLIDEAARSEDAGVREAARDAIFAHGGPRAHAALARYLGTETRVIDRSEMNGLLDDLKRPSLLSIRHAPTPGARVPRLQNPDDSP